MENLGKVDLFIIALVCSFLVSILQSHVVLSIAGLYKIDFVTQFTFIQIFGIILLFELLRYRYTITTSEEEQKSYVSKMTLPLLNRLLYVLLAWGLAFVFYDWLK